MFLFGRLYEGLASVDMAIVVLALSWSIAGAWRNARKRQLTEAGVSLGFSLCLLCISAFLWMIYQDWRPAVLAVPFAVAGFLRLQKRLDADIGNFAGTWVVGAVLLNYGIIAFLVLLSPFAMHNSDTLASVEPGGAYSAVVINRDGVTYGYDLLSLRPRAFGISTLLDRPDRYVAEFEVEQEVTALRWESKNHLKVLLRPGSEVVWRKSNWHGIAIEMATDPTAPPMK